MKIFRLINEANVLSGTVLDFFPVVLIKICFIINFTPQKLTKKQTKSKNVDFAFCIISTNRQLVKMVKCVIGQKINDPFVYSITTEY